MAPEKIDHKKQEKQEKQEGNTIFCKEIISISISNNYVLDSFFFSEGVL